MKFNNRYKYMINHEDPERYPICLYGIQCDCDGWLQPIDDLLNMLMQLDGYRRLRVYQIKEKFGQFRFYYNSTSLSNTERCKFQNQIDMYTDKINKTCEKCGKPGTLKTAEDGWLFTLCESCHETII